MAYQWQQLYNENTHTTQADEFDPDLEWDSADVALEQSSTTDDDDLVSYFFNNSTNGTKTASDKLEDNKMTTNVHVSSTLSRASNISVERYTNSMQHQKVNDHQAYPEACAKVNVIEPVADLLETDDIAKNGFVCGSSSGSTAFTSPCEVDQFCFENLESLIDIQPINIAPIFDSLHTETDFVERGEGRVPAEEPTGRLVQGKVAMRRVFRCGKCRKKLRSRFELLKHMRYFCEKRRQKEVTRLQFACLKCNYRSNGRIPLTTCILHTKIHDKPKYTCEECGERFRWWNSVLSHWKARHDLFTDDNELPVDAETLELEPETMEPEVVEDDWVVKVEIQECKPNSQKSPNLKSRDVDKTRGKSENERDATQTQPEVYCSLCDEVYPTMRSFALHMRLCYNCLCGEIHQNLTLCIVHMRHCSTNARQIYFKRGDSELFPWIVPCPGCSFQASTHVGLLSHLIAKKWHSDCDSFDPDFVKRYSVICPLCFFSPGAKFQLNLKSLMSHIFLEHTNTDLKQCVHCMQAFEHDELLEHLEVESFHRPDVLLRLCERQYISDALSAATHLAERSKVVVRCLGCVWNCQNNDGIVLLGDSTTSKKSRPRGFGHNAFTVQNDQEIHPAQHTHAQSINTVSVGNPASCRMFDEAQPKRTVVGRFGNKTCTGSNASQPKGLVETAGNQKKSWSCLACPQKLNTFSRLVTHLLSVHPDTVFIPNCKPSTIVVLCEHQTNSIVCLGCKACTLEDIWTLEEFEEHCEQQHHLGINAGWSSIHCPVTGCCAEFPSEITFYDHLAEKHKNDVEVSVFESGVVYILNQWHGKSHRSRKETIGRRCVCMFCKRVFFDLNRVRLHFLDRKIKRRISETLVQKTLRCSMPQDVLEHWLIRGKLGDRSKDQTSRQEECSVKFPACPVVYHGQVTPDKRCLGCEGLFGVSMPAGVCLARQQLQVRVSVSEISNYMVKYAMASLKPLPTWYRNAVTNSFSRAEQERQIGLAQWKFNSHYTSYSRGGGSLPGEDVCKLCYISHNARVRTDMCVHQRFRLGLSRGEQLRK